MDDVSERPVKKAKGIAFSLPVSDVVGLAVPEPEKKE